MTFAGDSGTFDIGFQALSGMIERGCGLCARERPTGFIVIVNEYPSRTP
jgi:hypothetical protein